MRYARDAQLEYLRRNQGAETELPLRITTYAHLTKGIADGVPPLGSSLPRETALCSALDVSRMIVRGSLDTQMTTPFISKHLGTEEGEEGESTLFCESILSNGDVPVAILQEHLPGRSELKHSLPDLYAALGRLDEVAEGSLYSALTSLGGFALTQGTCQVTANVVGSTRAKQLDLDAGAPVLVLTQLYLTSEVPTYLSKCIVSPEWGHISVRQTVSARSAIAN